VLEAVLQLIGHAAADIDLPGLLQRFRARLARFGFDVQRESAAGRKAHKRDAEQSGSGLAPAQSIAVDVPFIGRIANRLQNVCSIGPRVGSLAWGHVTCLFELCFYASRARLGATPKHSAKPERFPNRMPAKRLTACCLRVTLRKRQVSGIETAMDGKEAEINEAGQSRALTVVVNETRRSAPLRRDAAFLAHLIATKAHAPQTRINRRAEPQEVTAAYRAVARLA